MCRQWMFQPMLFVCLASVQPALAAQQIIHGNLGPAGEGRRMWLQLNCYGCHGNNAAGGMGPNVQHAEAGDLASAVLHGDAMEGGMRSFGKYATQADVTNLTAYLKTIGTAKEPTWLDWWKPKPQYVADGVEPAVGGGMVEKIAVLARGSVGPFASGTPASVGPA